MKLTDALNEQTISREVERIIQNRFKQIGEKANIAENYENSFNDYVSMIRSISSNLSEIKELLKIK